MDEIQYRDAELADLPEIVAIYNTIVAGRMVTADLEPVTVESREKWFYDHTPERRPLWMVSNNKGIAGWASFQDFYGRPAYNGTAEISIYLHPGSRGKGLGQQVLTYCMKQAPSLGINNLLGYIFAHNEPSIKLFQKMGFSEWANMPNIAVLDGVERTLKILGCRVS
ncbi:MAG TPA: GNAT family N-acetyltransferase [Chitinophagaceae bacterium]|jgi:phosphinothricin acetyltransferase|nr:GNAT family N-acetyltransferase [Chitinophagaceae bacterium]